MTRMGRSLLKEGHPITDPTQRQAMLEAVVQAYRQGKRVLFKRLGAF